MSNNMFRIILCLLMSYTLTADAQNTSDAKLYGQGVHAYNNGEYDAALSLFNAAVDQGSEDPRVFLFRGLVYHQQGKTEEAQEDLKHGAELEAVDKRGFYPVSPALIRVQGKVRLQIENLRREARANLVQIEKTRAAARYEEQKVNEAAALREPMPMDAPAIPIDAQQSTRPENPFAPSNIAGIKSNPSNVTVSKTNPKPSVDDKDPLANLANDNPMPANPVANNNPPANNTPPAINNPPAGNNPFAPGNDAPAANSNPPAGNNPFAPGNNAPANKPATKSGTLGAIFGSLNPFGGGNDEPAANAVPGGGKPPTSLDEFKKFIQGSLPGGGGGGANPGNNNPAPNGNNPFGPVPNPFK